jgi:NADH-quinone oxidoreductase subunit J
MAAFLFYLFALLTVVSAALVVVHKDPVNAAMSFLLSLVGLAGLFVLLDAALLAFVLLLVYAGAVASLFLFIIMLLDTRPEARRPFRLMTVVAATLGGALLLVCGASLFARAHLPAAPAAPAVGWDLQAYAGQLFTTYLLPVQVVGFLLLIAMLGVVVLSRKLPETEGTT